MLHALFLTMLLTATPAPVPPSHFQIAFTRTASGYEAECSSGCKWISLSFSCVAECNAVIDDSGVEVGAATKAGDPAFAFHFHRTAEGFQLVSLGGTHWEGLSWSCGALPCVAHVDEGGVSGSAVGG